MADIKQQVLQTLGDVMLWMAPYAGGSVPPPTDPSYNNWRRWIQLGQQDAANRTFWRRFLIPQTITIEANEDIFVLPDSFNKINGMYLLNVNGVGWNLPNNEDGQRVWVYMDPATAKYHCKFLGFTPTETVENAVLWYFYNPPIPTDEADKMYLDGEMCGFYALKEHFRKNSQFGSMDDARIEYENRYEGFSDLEVIPSPQELIQWANYSQYLGQSPSERQFYSGRGRGRTT
jgi:hypothetical protein